MKRMIIILAVLAPLATLGIASIPMPFDDSDKVHGHGDIYADHNPGTDIGDFEGTVSGNTLILNVDGEQVDFSWDEGGPILGQGFYASDSWWLPLQLLTMCAGSNIDGCYRWTWVLQVKSLADGNWVTVGTGTFVKS